MFYKPPVSWEPPEDRLHLDLTPNVTSYTSPDYPLHIALEVFKFYTISSCLVFLWIPVPDLLTQVSCIKLNMKTKSFISFPQQNNLPITFCEYTFTKILKEVRVSSSHTGQEFFPFHLLHPSLLPNLLFGRTREVCPFLTCNGSVGLRPWWFQYDLMWV